MASAGATFQAVSQVAAELFKHGAADRVIAAKMPPDRASMHLDTIFTFCDRDLVTIYEPVVNNITPVSYRPGDGDGRMDVTVHDEGWLAVVQEALDINIKFGQKLEEITAEEVLADHVIIAGFGLSGERLATALKQA